MELRMEHTGNLWGGVFDMGQFEGAVMVISKPN